MLFLLFVFLVMVSDGTDGSVV